LTVEEETQAIERAGADKLMYKPLPKFNELQKVLESVIKARREKTAQKQKNKPASSETTSTTSSTTKKDERTPMQNVAPTGALARRSRQWLQVAFVVVTGGVFMAVIGLALFAIPLAVEGNRVFGLYNFIRTILLIGGVITGLVGLGLAARAYLTRVDNDLAAITGQHLARYLGSEFTFVRNVNKRGLGYIDAVLVGPPGALVFRIVDNTGVYANERGNWLTQNRNGEWVPAKINPTADDVVDI